MKRGSHYIGFYSLVMALNSAAAGMFLVVSTPPPPPPTHIVYPVIARPVAAVSGTPNRIVIPAININLPVGVGTYNQTSDEWTLSDSEAYYADVSLPANDSNGVTLIYGHDRSPVFARLIGLKSGMQADVYTDSGHVFRYQYHSSSNVAPSDTSIFTASGPPTLLLQTCGGTWSEYRTIYSFAFVSEAQA